MGSSEIQPKNLYQVQKAVPLDDKQQAALIDLYQPIIGLDAVGLYFTLYGDANDPQMEFTHVNIFNGVGYGLQRFLPARYQLEGISLLKTYQQTDPEFGLRFLYILQAPLTPTAFFRDELLAFLLLNKIGEDKFQQLQRRFAPKAITTEGYQEITKKFSDVYTWSSDGFAQKQGELQAAAQTFGDLETPSLKLNYEGLDWSLLTSLAAKKFIGKKALTDSLKQKLVLYHDLYGYDEIQLVALLAEVVSLTDGSIDEKALAKLVTENETSGQTKSSQFFDASSDQQTRRKNTLLQQGFTLADWQTIEESEQLAPLIYLKAIKQAKNSFPTKNEEWLITDLVQKSPLPNSVINILLNYLLVVQKNSSLPSALANQIATDWSEQGIRTPEAAIAHIRTLKNEALEKRSQRSQRKGQYQTNAPRKTETVPDWSQESTSSDPKRKAEIDRMMNEFFTNEEGE